MTPEQVKATVEVANAIVAVVKEAGPLGAPGGMIYAAMMANGCDLATYETFMAGLVAAGRLRKNGDFYFLKEITH